MLLNNKTGIICDHCGRTVQTRFTYYSLDFRIRKATNNCLEALEYNSAPNYSCDICDKCYENIKNLVLKYYKPAISKPSRIYPNGISCDLTGTRLQGTFKFCHIVVDKVEIDIPSGQQAIDKRHLELWTIESILQNYKTKQNAVIQNRQTEEWSSSASLPHQK